VFFIKPVIGIFPSYDNEKKQFYINSSYTDAVSKSGGIPFILTLSSSPEKITEFIERVDGIIFSGGSDIDPEYYNEINDGKSLEICAFRDECEAAAVRLAVDADIPVLGICRGMQALNVFCGGSMIQDIPSECDTNIIHSLKKPDVAFHKISVEKFSPLSDIIGFGEHLVNSYHHQAANKIAPDFSVCAVSEDGITESIFHKNKKFVLGVQWHPERDQETATINKKILDRFIEICSETKKG
jgi:putative glutamine amidotransferase